jgi:Putative Na+/H+ antiporter
LVKGLCATRIARLGLFDVKKKICRTADAKLVSAQNNVFAAFRHHSCLRCPNPFECGSYLQSFNSTTFQNMKDFAWLLIVLLLSVGQIESVWAAAALPSGAEPRFPKPVEEYHDEQIPGIAAKLVKRIQVEPFNLVGTLIFLGAIIHTFLASKFMLIAHRLEHEFHALEEQEKDTPNNKELSQMRDRLQFRAQVFHFFGEVEAVFGIWLIPLAIAILVMKGWSTLTSYAASIDPAEPVFVVVIMAMASSRPVLRFAEACLAKVASLGRSTVAAWWLAILSVGPLLGSFITEPAAMTICALLLRQKFYDLRPSSQLRYATLALLFVNISVGGSLSHFAAPPIVMVATRWDWGLPFMLTNFGWKAVLGILVANTIYYLRFRRELVELRPKPGKGESEQRSIPNRIIVVHLLFIAWAVLAAHYPLLVVLGFLFFLAFVEATRRYQVVTSLRGPLLVGFFLLALVIHGRIEQWWIEPVLSSLSEWPLMIGAMLLTALNDNAAITYLASLVPGFSDSLKYAVVAGAVAGGGLTVIANAPNPAGQSILVSRFGDEGISAVKLFLWAILPTVIMGAAFMLLR